MQSGEEKNGSENGRGEQKLEEGEVVAAVVKIRKHGARTFTLERGRSNGEKLGIATKWEGRGRFFLNCKLTAVSHGIVASGGRHE